VTRHQAVLFRQILLVYDVLVSICAFLVALQLREWLATTGMADEHPLIEVLPVNVADYYPLLWGLVPMWTLAFYWTGAPDFRVSYRRTAGRYARAVAIGLVLFVVVAFLYKVAFVARSFVFLLGATQLVALVCGRFMLLEAVAALRRQGIDGHRVLVVGCGEQAVAFASSLKKNSPWNNRFIGHVTVPGEAVQPAAEPIVGAVEGLAAMLDSQPVDEVVFAVPGYDAERFSQAIAACDERGVDVLLTMPSVLPPSSAKFEIANMTGFDLPMLGMSRVPTSQGRLLVKRLLDIGGALFGLVLAGPVLIGAAIAIKLNSRGPVFFSQVRAGRHGRKFRMMKFRSMVVDAEALRAKLEHLNEMNGPVFKIKHDPRITSVGRFLRKTSIDELPQLFNVLLGDMSLVGPRPPLPSEVTQYEAWQRRRLSVKPGLTGLWQVSGRNQVDFDQWMELDLQYIDNWSLWLDLKIIFRTVPVVLRGSGAS
jgi:exopolysaccharide biosynthesis polyprenyl glycosylphosphotransferase